MKMMHPTYQEKNTQEKIKAQLIKTNIVLLNYFLIPRAYKQYAKKLSNAMFKHQKIPNRFSYHITSTSPPIVKNKELIIFLKTITNKTPNKITIKKFKHRDYTLLNDSQKHKQETKCLLFFTKTVWNPFHGGNIVILDKNKTKIITPEPNTLAIINKKKSDKEFVQYIGHKANKNEFILIEVSMR